MRDNVDVARRFYTALRSLDSLGIRDTLAPDFTLYIAEGMPGGYGGRHTGPDAALNEVWGPVYATFGAVGYAEELLPAGDETVVAVGEYRGRPPETGRPFRASFVHILRIHGGKIAELRQLTDTYQWHQALIQSD